MTTLPPLLPVTLITESTSRPSHHLLACDGNCQKAFGLVARPHVYCGPPGLEEHADHRDDIAYLADDEVPDAFAGTSDASDVSDDAGKPSFPPTRHTRFCRRDCERLVVATFGAPVLLPDWSARVYNEPYKHTDLPAQGACPVPTALVPAAPQSAAARIEATHPGRALRPDDLALLRLVARTAVVLRDAAVLRTSSATADRLHTMAVLAHRTALVSYAGPAPETPETP